MTARSIPALRPATLGRLAIVPLILMLAACAQPASRDGSEITAESARWEQALNRGDVDSLAAIYAPDCRLMPPNAAAIQGRAGAKEMFAGMIADGLKVKLQSTEARIAADIGYHVGTYTVLSADGADLDHGKYIEVWRKIGDGWHIANDIWNSDVPAAKPAAAVLMITHEVKDPDHWLAAWSGSSSRRGMFMEHGAAGVHVMRSTDTPNLTGLMIDVADMDAFNAFMAMPETQAAKKADGVKDANFHVFTEVK